MNIYGGPGFGMFGGFDLFSILFSLTFILVLGTIVVTLFRGLKQWNRNNHAPKLTVEATVVGKRDHVSRRRRSGAGYHQHYSTSTSYFATFQVESGDRMELQMGGQEFGLLVEGDRGKLTFQGTRYLGFSRM